MHEIDNEIAAEHKLLNTIHSIVLIAGMMLLLGLCGELIFGSGAFFWIAIITGLFLLLTPALPAPLVMKMFGATRLNTAQAPVLYGLIKELTERAELPAIPALYYLPSMTMNAFTVGDRGQPAIAVTDGLLRSLNYREIAGVLAHEVSHIHNNDIRVMGLADVISRTIHFLSTFGLLLVLINLPLLILGVTTISWTGLLLLLIAPSLTALMQSGLSRTREFNADIYAANITADPEGLASALYKIEYREKNWLQRILFPGYREQVPSWLRSHPPVEERIRRLLSMSQKNHLSEMHNLPGEFIPRDIAATTRRPGRHWHGLWH